MWRRRAEFARTEASDRSLFLGASYFSSASRDIALTQSNASDVAGLRVGGSLAISPSTSVTTGFNLLPYQPTFYRFRGAEFGSRIDYR
jgi:hypothetical protein